MVDGTVVAKDNDASTGASGDRSKKYPPSPTSGMHNTPVTIRPHPHHFTVEIR